MNNRTRQLPLTARLAGIFLSLAASALTLVAPASAATTFTQALDVRQGLAFQSSLPYSFGQVTALTLGSMALTPDLLSVDPTQSPAAQSGAVGILIDDAWSGVVSSPLDLSFQVSTANRAALVTYLSQPTASRAVRIAFRSFSFDQTAKRWFQSFGPTNDMTLDALIAVSGGQLAISVGSAPFSPAGLPSTYTVHVQLVPGTQTGESMMESTSWGNVRVLAW